MSTGAQVDILNVAGSLAVESVQLPLMGSTYTMAELIAQTADAAQPTMQAASFRRIAAVSLAGTQDPVSLSQFATAPAPTSVSGSSTLADLQVVPATDISEYSQLQQTGLLMPTTADSQVTAANDPTPLGLLTPPKKSVDFGLLQA